MIIEHRTIGNKTGFFVSHEPQAQVAVGPFDTTEDAEKWIAKHESEQKG